MDEDFQKSKPIKIGDFEIDKIYLTDCLDGMERLPDKSIDLVFIDPPYNVGKDYGVSKDNLSHDEYINFMKAVISEFKRVAKRGFGIYTDWKHFQEFWQLIPEAEPIIIFKRSSGVVFSSLNIVQHHHVILTTAKCMIRICKSLWDDIRVFGEGYFFNERTFGHPAQTSLKATKRFIENFSEEGEVILDCFMGTGTTAIACKQTIRNFIGFELNPTYVEIANKRLAQKTLDEVSRLKTKR